MGRKYPWEGCFPLIMYFINFILINNQVPIQLIFLKVIDTQLSALTRRQIFRNSCHCWLTKLTVAVLNLSHLVTIELRCKVWAATYWQLCGLSVWKLCSFFLLGNFNGMASVKYMDFLRANTFPVHCGCAMAAKKQNKKRNNKTNKERNDMMVFCILHV